MRKLILITSILIFLLESFILPQSQFVQVVDFDGNGDYANTFNNPYFPTINGTMEAWVKVRSISLPGGNEGEAFVAKNEEQWNNGDFYVFFEYGTGRLVSRIQKPPSIEIDVVSNNNFWQSYNQWVHYAFTWGANGMKMYINGVLQNNQNNFSYSALNNDYNFYVGAHGYKLHSGQYVVSDFFDGQMDELRIWNYQKSSQQINALKDAPLDVSYYNTIDSGLVGYWRFDVLEDLGVNNDGQDDIRDFSVLNNHLDLAGNAHLVLPDPVIPIELISFVFNSMNGKVKLSWSTASELNNYGFEIERCNNDRQWRTIGFIKGKGTTTEIQYYTFFDDLFGVNSEIIYYRLKQVDYSGHFAYSGELEVNTPPVSFNLYQNYPNPFNPVTIIRYAVPKSASVTLTIYDVLGKLVGKPVDETKTAGYYQVEFDGSNLANGVYFYTLASDNVSMTKKMLLLK